MLSAPLLGAAGFGFFRSELGFNGTVLRLAAGGVGAFGGFATGANWGRRFAARGVIADDAQEESAAS